MVLMEKGPVKKYVADIAVSAYKKDGFTVAGGGAVSPKAPAKKAAAKATAKTGKKKPEKDKAEEAVDETVTEETAEVEPEKGE